MNKDIADYISYYKLHYGYDKEFLVNATQFPIDTELVKTDFMSIVKDIGEEGVPVVKPKSLSGYTYRRKPYLTASFDLFDIIRSLPKKAYILFKYIIENIELSSNHITLTTEEIETAIGCNVQPVVSKAINDLIRAGLICKSTEPNTKNVYCINHQEYFKGAYSSFIYKYSKIYNNTNKDKTVQKDINITDDKCNY